MAELPRSTSRRYDEPIVPDVAFDAASSQTRRAPTATPVLAGLRILVVEDDPTSAKLLSVALAVDGALVCVATTAEDALLQVTCFVPQVIVLELVLPFMSGLLLAQRLKANAATRGIVIIAVTAFNGPQTERVSRAAGCSAYVRKPIDVLSFAQLVSAHLGEHS
jgi:two-component system, cell cycle response regulator DivK